MLDKEITKDNPYKLCFVCLGNICRSPTAEGVFQHLVNERDLQPYFEVDSAGTSAYHVGESANSKSQQTAKQHGITLHSKARQFESFDLDYFDLVLAMDQENLTNINRMRNDSTENVEIGMLRDFDPEPGDGEVPDPYYGGIQGFENVFQIVKRSCVNLLDRLEPNIKNN
ncbi:MAG TPA: low molecular weight protein-tyrosine-phosphatase [Halalkalibaculum sp.]|nr:low molecular weight protein-tyrosine-phosphatase [Halalkalibaculum sp.]